MSSCGGGVGHVTASPLTSATAAEEAAAIAASYARGHRTTYYVECDRLPSATTRLRSATAQDTHAGASPAVPLFTLGDFSILPHPSYAGRSGKGLDKPLYLHHLQW
ncbi:hypothetical protein NESM_000398700 [Novymonas esmeraldas]|uniref:Uncharacterized protein n=1 Tax=Novymonas esmeraldas TaxID=1808958 RepID=A0AAW0EM98_9TRYP